MRAPLEIILLVVLVAAFSATRADVFLRCDIGTTLSPCVGLPDQNLKEGWTLLTSQDDCYKSGNDADPCWKHDHPGGVYVDYPRVIALGLSYPVRH